MLVRFHVSAIKDRERDLAEAIGAGARIVGDQFEVVTTKDFDKPSNGVDIAAVFALKGESRHILEAYRAIGKRTLLFDKGLMRASTGLGGPTGFYRVGLDEFMPLSRIARQMTEKVSAHRWNALGMELRPRVNSQYDSAVIYCGSSQKYCDFHDLGDEHEYAVSVIDQIKRLCGNRPIIYRPKPSFLEATKIKGTIFSHSTPGNPAAPLASLLPSAHALVTHGSHAGIDSIMGGVPVITLGPCAAYSLANHHIDRLEGDLYYPKTDQIHRWLCAITHWQWTIKEMASGEMWRWLRDEMEKPA